VLKMLFDETGLKSPIFYSEDFAIDGGDAQEALRNAVEGIVSKNVESPYRLGRS